MPSSKTPESHQGWHFTDEEMERASLPCGEVTVEALTLGPREPLGGLSLSLQEVRRSGQACSSWTRCSSLTRGLWSIGNAWSWPMRSGDRGGGGLRASG